MSDYSLVYYKDIESRKIDWLWYPYIPFGKITLVQGDPGEGKTTFILSLLSVLSTGGRLPCSDIKISGNAIYQNTEDDNADTIKPRLERHGADCSKICFINKGIDALQGLLGESLRSDVLGYTVQIQGAWETGDLRRRVSVPVQAE